VVKDLIDEKVALLKKANLFADGFGVPAMVVAEVYEATTFTQETGVIFLDLGHFASNISIVYKGQAIFSRIFSTGCYHLEEALKTVFVSERGAVKFTDEEVAEILYKEGVFGNKPDNKYKGITNFQIMALMRPVLERLENEINRTRDYLKQTSFSFAIRKIFICGGGAGIKNFDLYLAKVSGLDVVVDNKVNWLLLPKDKSGQLVGFNIPQYAMVLGTAKGGIKTALPLVSEARGKFAFMDFFFLRNALAVVFFLSSVLYMTLVIINFSYYQRLFYLEKRIEELEWVNVQSLPTQTKSESEKFFDKMAYDPGRITEFLKYLGNELPKEVVLEFMAINNDNGMIKLRGHIYHNDVSPEENLAKIMSAIKNYGQFGSPHLLQGVVKEDLEGKPIFFDLEITGGSK
jgi:hypothetical protein